MKWYALLIVCVQLCNSVSGCGRRGATYSPKTGPELTEVLSKISGSDIIELLPIEYSGDFILPAKGSTITLKGTTDKKTYTTTTIKGSGTVLSIQGGIWHVESLGILSGSVGIFVKGNGHLLKSISIQGVNEGVKIQGDGSSFEAVSIKGGDKGLTIKGNKNNFKSISLSDQKSYGVNLESGDGNSFDTFSVTKSPLSMQLGGNGGHLNILNADGLVDIRGSKYSLETVSIKSSLNLQGCNNSIRKSSIGSLYASKQCENDIGGASNSIRNVLNSPSTA